MKERPLENQLRSSSFHTPTMDVYLLNSALLAASHEHWRPPQALYIHGRAHNERHFVTGGGLVLDGSTLYMLTVEDISILGWASCRQSSSGSHSRCQQSSKTIYYAQHTQLEMMGVMGTLVHLSRDYGYGLIRIDPRMYMGEEDAVAQEAIPIDELETFVDTPQVMDFVEFTNAHGEEVTGVVAAQKNFCVESRGSRKRHQGLVVNTASYPVSPEDCGIWVRRSIASDRPMLLGHIVGFNEGSDYGMLMLPFERFRADLYRTIKRGHFNLL
ncbi:hypothetical protein F5B20DRAFT_541986 [Whalleya microplaca]|nr:hypothetical protein F5B20DRAFT_541986 [Whalleya microplaca]